jgi:cytochrome c biogenesis protein CcdA
MRSKGSLIALGVRVSALSLLFFASFTASLYLPHQSPWWRIATMVLIVMFGVSAVRGYRRRIELRRQNAGSDLGRE